MNNTNNSSMKMRVPGAKQAIENGANEIDMVINISDVKNGDYDKVTAEIKALKDTNYPDYMVWLASGDKKDIDRIKSGF